MGLAFVGMMIPDGNNQFFSRLAQLVQRELSIAGGTGMLLLDSDGSASTEREYIRWIADQRAQGLISGVVYIPTGDNIDNFFQLFSVEDVPIVVLDREIPEGFASRPIDLVLADNASGMLLVAEHLISIGITTVAYIAGPTGTEPGRVRNTAFEQYWRDLAGAAITASFQGDFSFESGKVAGEAVQRLAPVPEAVVAANDLMALGALQALLRAGLQVPDDIVVIGYDDIALANWVYPSLTTVRQDVEEMARQAANHVVRRMSGEGGRGGVRTPIDPELVIRESSQR